MRGDHPNRLIHFTFDDGPREDTTGPLLDLLAAAEIRATFFIVGRRVDPTRAGAAGRIAIVRDMLARGHTVGVHTYDHADLPTLSDADVRAELDRMESVVDPALGARALLFRAPFGHHDSRIDRVVRERGYTHVRFNMPVVGREPTTRAVAEDFAEQLRARERHRDGPGALVVLHDTDDHVVRAVPRIREALDARNCELLAAGEELWDVTDTLGPFCRPRPPREAPRRYARADALAPELLAARQSALRARYVARCAAR